MRKDITITAEPRASRGKNEARRLRVDQKIPAVLYGAGGDPVAVTVSPKEVNKILFSASGHNTIFNVEVTGQETSPVLVVDWQHDPVKGNLLHIDLMRVDLSKRLKVKIPIHTTGEARGVKQQGGLYQLVNREIEVECLPDDIPESFTVDITPLLIGDAIRAKDIPLTGSMTLLSRPELVLSHVIAVRGSTTEAAGEAEAQPAGKKK
ncbi:MAG: 50S ribosomal protein L25 [Bryobacteraceae bacterium]|nr:50S ribosomal protein L25 [Solibacteraceae bacterium]MCO5353837.1 50S ribosomal protein L25 [Bryobacteraceae bacterium]HRJ22222.1 50S ribosomal protein L25 [Bryobacteraceae bacterium]